MGEFRAKPYMARLDAPDARRDRPADPDPDLYRDGRRADRLAAGRPHRDRAARGHRAARQRRDDARRFRQRRRHADPGAPVRDDDHLGAVRRNRALSICAPARSPSTRGRHGGAAGADRRDRRRAVGGTRQRHPDHRDRAAADRRSAEPRARPAAVRDRARRRDQCRLGGDADRQPAKHPARRDRPARLLDISRDLRRAGAVRAGRRLRASSGCNGAGASTPDGARGERAMRRR